MPRGRPYNLPRAEARAAGQKCYAADPCGACFDDQRYVSNARCVTCSIHSGKNRYARLVAEDGAAVRERNHERYVQRAKVKAERTAEAIAAYSCGDEPGPAPVDDEDFL